MTDNDETAQEIRTLGVDTPSSGGGCAMSEKLLALIEKTRRIEPTPEQEREQEIGFAYGNVHFENPRVTRQLVEQSLPACDNEVESDR